jgi:hypothetical protein
MFGLQGNLMFKTLLLACFTAGLMAAAPVAVHAKTYTVPDPGAVAIVTIPDDWTATALPKGVEALSEDEAVYVAIEVTDLQDVAKAIADAIVWLKSKDVVLDRATQAQQDITINGLTGVQIKWEAKDVDGPTQVSLTVLQASDTKGLVLTYWGTEEGAKENAVDLNTIITSLKLVK